MTKSRISLLLFILLTAVRGFSQEIETAEITQLIQQFKQDPRGPYQAIRWFCPDGTIIPANQRCAEQGGIQHALPKEVVQRLASQQKIYLGQILAGTPYDDFWNSENLNSRIKQYQLEKFLQAADNGWIVRRARFYRGAVQVEDEEQWGLSFLNWLVARDATVKSQYFLVRQAVKTIPHQAANNRLQNIRALSKSISDSLSSFMDIRVKIHGQPDEKDLQLVRLFRAANPDLPSILNEGLKTLENELALVYQSSKLAELANYLPKLPKDSPIASRLAKLVAAHNSASQTWDQQRISVVCSEIAGLLWDIRKRVRAIKPSENRLLLFDLSEKLENIFYREINRWQPESLGDLLNKGYILARACVGTGYLEVWEWEAIEPYFHRDARSSNIKLETLLLKSSYLRRVAEWGAGMVRANYDAVVFLYADFEPLALGMIDDLVRSSSLLALGELCSELAEFIAQYTHAANYLLNTAGQGTARGLNPGFAVGELRVVAGAPEAETYQSDKIYVLQRPPADLKPVAGIATVSEGNLVSHVQILARNLGIPNARISLQSLDELAKFSGQKVFFAVSPRGTVIMKSFSEMNTEERALVTVAQRANDRVSVPTDRIRLDHTALSELKNLRAVDSGRICGPKAANLGQLKHIFPGQVVDGFIIPFGVFRMHLDQQMAGTGLSYWEFLQQTFSLAATQRKNGRDEAEIESMLLSRLARLREAIKNMPLLSEFQSSLQKRFDQVFGVKLGQLPVFIRSDTNMEDLKDFSGAGLNLTVFNVVEKERFFQGIKDVWASPYTERSYRWRQRYLSNPENVFPSILILPSVAVDNSGVMITTGVPSSDDRDITIAFSRGAGGAVEGQAAETYLLKPDGKNQLFSPAREMTFNTLPSTGGIKKASAFLDQRILDPHKLGQLRNFAAEIKRKLPGTPGIQGAGPFDVELGFKGDKLWLFQVRPYVENKRARSTGYLQSLDPELPQNVTISINERLRS